MEKMKINCINILACQFSFNSTMTTNETKKHATAKKKDNTKWEKRIPRVKRSKGERHLNSKFLWLCFDLQPRNNILRGTVRLGLFTKVYSLKLQP